MREDIDRIDRMERRDVGIRLGFETIGARAHDVKPVMPRPSPLIHCVYYDEEARRASGR